VISHKYVYCRCSFKKKSLSYKSLRRVDSCTYSVQENEQNAAWLAWNFGYQLYLRRVRGENFYIACFRKTDSASATRVKRNATGCGVARRLVAGELRRVTPETVISTRTELN
jgi:hypothetical protein